MTLLLLLYPAPSIHLTASLESSTRPAARDS